jgi:GNAT superfamily N-acetyltransferase
LIPRASTWRGGGRAPALPGGVPSGEPHPAVTPATETLNHGKPMSLEAVIENYPVELELKGGFKCQLRPLERADEAAFFEFFQQVPAEERMFIKHRIEDRAVIRQWCENIDYLAKLPLLALQDGKIIGAATLHQSQGGWKRHIGRVSVLVLPQCRGRGLARRMIREICELAQHAGLDFVEAEFIGTQAAAMKMFGLLGFTPLVSLPKYVRDMQGRAHDYTLMSMPLKTDEEYAGMG